MPGNMASTNGPIYNRGRIEIELLLLENATIMLFTDKINHENTVHSVQPAGDLQFLKVRKCINIHIYTRLYVLYTTV